LIHPSSVEGKTWERHGRSIAELGAVKLKHKLKQWNAFSLCTLSRDTEVNVTDLEGRLL
jgi:hypothetical protein